MPETPPLKAFWQPGFTSCLRLKEFLSVRGIEFESINVLEDAAGRAELQRIGARSIPVLSRGDKFVFAQNIAQVVAFLKLDEKAGPVLSPAQLVERMRLFIDAGSAGRADAACHRRGVAHHPADARRQARYRSAQPSAQISRGRPPYVPHP